MTLKVDAWNELPEHLQKVLTDVMTGMEIDSMPRDHDSIEEYLQKYQEGGCELITFPPADAEWFVELYYKSEWEAVKQKVPPHVYDRMREVTCSD